MSFVAVVHSSPTGVGVTPCAVTYIGTLGALGAKDTSSKLAATAEVEDLRNVAPTSASTSAITTRTTIRSFRTVTAPIQPTRFSSSTVPAHSRSVATSHTGANRRNRANRSRYRSGCHTTRRKAFISNPFPTVVSRSCAGCVRYVPVCLGCHRELTP
ncbi:hypothetical protein X942_4626 [Burkholderia pseudomallei MSHR5596]|nr:hypothetical protein X942_4626 [Burkholderia pseudomallei MSHR5596]